jgi:hypothetical protein
MGPEANIHVQAPDLVIPARMLNEFVYCPRLAYLMWVQGEFAHNADTVEGDDEGMRPVDYKKGNLLYSYGKNGRQNNDWFESAVLLCSDLNGRAKDFTPMRHMDRHPPGGVKRAETGTACKSFPNGTTSLPV